MNILLINHYAGSQTYGMEYRAYYLAKEWVKQGHKVTIVAATFSHLRLNNPVVAKDYQDEMIDGIRLINPGSCNHNRSYANPTYAIINIDKDSKIDLKFIEC